MVFKQRRLSVKVIHLLSVLISSRCYLVPALLAAGPEQALAAGTVHSYIKYRPKRYQIPPLPGRQLAPELYNMLAEVAMYHASRDLGFDLVPMTILKKQAGRLCSCMQWIESTKLPVQSSSQLCQLVSPADYAKMQLFCFLFAKYDNHLGNIIVAKDSYRLYLIDNESVAVLAQTVTDYSPERALVLSWVPQVALPWRQLATLPAATVWRQTWLERETVPAPFSPVITPELLAKLQELALTQVMSYWPSLPTNFSGAQQQEYAEFVQAFAQRTLTRAKMMTAYFALHPSAVKALATQPAVTLALRLQAKRLDCEVEPFLYLFC